MYTGGVILTPQFLLRTLWVLGGGGQIRRRGYLSVTDDVKILHGVKGISPP